MTRQHFRDGFDTMHLRPASKGNRRGFARCLLVLAGCLSLMTVARADLQQGLEAANRQDWHQALTEFTALAERGQPAAMVNLGNLYMRGLGVAQDYQQARYWYERAAKHADRAGESKLGLLYYYGLGVSVDYGEAAKWFERAARQGETGAETILASLYARGEGVDRDLARAYVWYTRAMAQGSEDAAEARAELVEEMSPGEMSEALSQLAALDSQAEIEIPSPAPVKVLASKKARQHATAAASRHGKTRHGRAGKKHAPGRHGPRHRHRG